MSARLEEVKFNLETGGRVTYEDRRWLISEVETLRAQLATARDAALDSALQALRALSPSLGKDEAIAAIRALKGEGR